MSFLSRLFGVKSVPAVTVSEIPIMNTSIGWSPGGDFGAIYRRQPAVRTVVDFLARNVAQLKPKIYERIDNDDRLELSEHPMVVQLANPNPMTTAFRLWRDTMTDIGIYDRAYWQKVRQRGLVRALIRIPPTQITLEYDNQTGRRTYRLSGGAVVNRDDLVIFSGYHPDGSEDGVSPLETLRRVLAEEWAAVNNRENMWRNASRHQLVLSRPADAPEWSDIARERFRKDWQSSMTGAPNAGKTAILEDGMSASAISAFSAKDSDYIEGRKLTYNEVALAYGGSTLATLVTGIGLIGSAGTDSMHTQLYQDVLAPITRSLEDELELQLLPEFETTPARRARVYVEFNLQEKLRGSFEQQARALVTAVGVPYLGVNEARAMLNRPRVEDDSLDVPVKPMNVMYGNQPAVTIPTDDPGTSLRAQNLADLPVKLAEFFERQHETIRRNLGGLEDYGRLSVLTVWDDKRWNKELARVFLKVMPLDDAEKTAEHLNILHRDQVASRFAEGGLDAVRAVFAEAKAAADEYASLRIR